jgi:long-chain-fatty-acid--CoA ligase ACSBG
MAGKGTVWVTEPSGYLEPKIGKSGYAAKAAITVPAAFKSTVDKFPTRPALGVLRAPKDLDAEGLKKWMDAHKENSNPLSDYTVWTWSDYWSDCMKFAKALLKLNVSKFDVINIIGFNSPEWLISNLGSNLAGCIAAGVYSTNSAEQCHYPTNHSKAKVVILEDNKQLKKYTENSSPYVALKTIAVWAETPQADLVTSLKKKGITVVSWTEFLELGSSTSDDKVAERYNSIKPGHCSSLIYTSGTTGNPKAVMISHDNITWTAGDLMQHYMDLGCDDRVVSFLPLSHIAAQICDIYFPLLTGGATYFARPDALKGTLTDSLRDVRPTIFFGVPRVWEKIQEKMLSVGATITGLKKTISTWAKGVGKYKNEGAQFGGHGSLAFGTGCASTIIWSKVRNTLGLDKVKGCFTAAAPISPDVIWYFASLDIPVYEVFGQSECTGPHTVSYKGEWKVGTCGRPMYGTESKIVLENGELCYRGRHIFMGYMYDEEKTRETIDPEGYLHSGDVAEFDEDCKSVANKDLEDFTGPSGFMKITGRIKELIITKGGENIPPVLIENNMKGAMPALSNCMVVGDQRKFLTMLVSLKCEVDDVMKPTDALTADTIRVGKSIGSSATTLSAAMNDTAWNKYVEDGMKAGNALKISAAQTIQKYAWLPVDFSEVEGDLTPTLKLKRAVVLKKWAGVIDKMYGETVDGKAVK